MDFTKKKYKKTSAKARLISYYNRHHSNSPILTSRPGTSLETVNSNASVQNNKKLSIMSKSSLGKNLDFKSSENISLNKELSSSSPDLRLEPENQKNNLSKKEQELNSKEQHLLEKEQKLIETQKDLNSLALKLMSREKELAKEEESLKIRKTQIMNEVNKELESKFRELSAQRMGLERLLQNLNMKMAEFNRKKEESGFVDESESDSWFDSRLEFEDMDEHSQVSSECESFEYSKQKNLILASCKQLSQENTEITSKIDEILTSFSCQSRY